MSSYWEQLTKSAKSFVDTVDPNMQQKVEADIEQGKISEKQMDILQQKQEEIRDKIEKYGVEMSVNNMKQLLTSEPDISNDIKSVFTYYYTEIMDRIPREKENNINDTVNDIQNLDITIQLMYCIELMCNPENYVLNYETHTVFSKDELDEAIKKCAQEEPDVLKPRIPITGKRDHVTGITTHPLRRVDPTGTKKRRLIPSGGRKKSKKTKSKKTKSKKTKSKKTKSKKTKSKKTKRK